MNLNFTTVCDNKLTENVQNSETVYLFICLLSSCIWKQKTPEMQENSTIKYAQRIINWWRKRIKNCKLIKTTLQLFFFRSLFLTTVFWTCGLDRVLNLRRPKFRRRPTITCWISCASVRSSCWNWWRNWKHPEKMSNSWRNRWKLKKSVNYFELEYFSLS